LTDKSTRRDGPTDRIGLLAGAAAEEAAVVLAGSSGAGAVVAVVAVEGVPFLAAADVVGLVGARDIFLALSSVTMISPCCWAAVVSSMVLSASAQVCPAALHEQDGLNSWR
jgi:hypothetical protein